MCALCRAVAILGWYLGEVTTAFARSPHWFRVDFNGREGWVSSHWVTTDGDCS